MQKTHTLLSQNLYTNHLLTINDIHFTRQEIDVIARFLIAKKISKVVYFISVTTANFHFKDLKKP